MQLVHGTLLRRYLCCHVAAREQQLAVVQPCEHLPLFHRIPGIHEQLRNAVTLAERQRNLPYIHIAGQLQLMRLGQSQLLLMYMIEPATQPQQQEYPHDCQDLSSFRHLDQRPFYFRMRTHSVPVKSKSNLNLI